MKSFGSISKKRLFFVVLCLWLLLPVGVMLAAPIVEAEPITASETIPIGDFRLPDNYKFIIITLGAGGIAGWAVGFTLKKVAKLLALVLGIAFISLQFLAFKKLITIDWAKIEGLYGNNREIEGYVSGLMSIVTYNLPFVGSFLAGFWLGFRKG